MALFGDTPEKRGEKIVKLIQRRGFDSDGKEQINQLLTKGVVLPSHPDNPGILSLAIYNRHQKLIDYCIKNKVDLNKYAFFSGNPLVAALDHRMNDVARRLVSAGVDVKQTDRQDRTTLMLALRNNDLQLARTLVKKKLSPQAKTGSGYSCVNAALESGNVEVLDYVLSFKPPLDTVYDSRPLLFAAIDTGKAEMFDRLVKAGCKIDIQAKGPWGQSLLTYAKEKGHKDVKARLNAIAAKKREIKQAAEKAARTGWRLNGAHEVCRIEEPEQIPYKVTEIFNFNSGIYTRINQNLETKAESTAVMNISAIANAEFVATAIDQLKELGGTLPQTTQGLASVINPVPKTIISKPTGSPS